MRSAVRVAAVVLGAALAGCAGDTAREQLADRARVDLVGMPKSRLLACAGVPERQATADGAEYYTYVQNPAYASAGGPSTSIGIGGGSGSGVGVGIGFGFPLFSGGGSSTSGCEATFVLREGTVRQISYPAGTRLADCAPIVDNCMPPAR